ncbi:MAG: patatin [Symploca sp. SIO1C4]|uniref:Patatin n=1 Tax=Symploca sp. SIO1C4 TaxID=2607765 RepID=A0A6B3N1U8_9CYAN|nr:patatin [Symploca sp. SIO1C4]
MTYKILSLDGGGIRGVLSAKILDEIEAIVAKQHPGKKLNQYFNLIAGTSTGSILAAGLACQMEAKQLIDLYKNEGGNIFLKSVYLQRQPKKPIRWLQRRLTAYGLRQLTSWLRRLGGTYALYPHQKGNQGLAKVLERNLIYKGKSPKITEITEPLLLILAYDVFSRNTTWFTNQHPSDYIPWYNNIELWEICTASASAPTFFSPYKLSYNSEKYLTHIDGGVSANNPALSAIAHALWMNRENPEKCNLNNIAVLSIGTGKTTQRYEYDDIAQWGLAGWASHIPDIFLDPSAKNSEDICRQLLRSLGRNYLRLDFNLNEHSKEGEVYNKYIKIKKQITKPIKEEIDNPDNCQDLIEAAQCYLDCGEVDYKGKTVPVRSAIQQFIESH